MQFFIFCDIFKDNFVMPLFFVDVLFLILTAMMRPQNQESQRFSELFKISNAFDNLQKQPFVDAFQNRCFLKFKNFALVTGQHLCWSLFKIKFRSIIRFPVTVVKIQEQFFSRISPVAASGFTEPIFISVRLVIY